MYALANVPKMGFSILFDGTGNRLYLFIVASGNLRVQAKFRIPVDVFIGYQVSVTEQSCM